MKHPRVRHHTDDEGLDGIKAEGAIHLSRGWGGCPTGIHVEVEPFGTTRPYRNDQEDRPSPKSELSLREDGAYVEFDVPPGIELLHYSYGRRNTALIPTERPLVLDGLKPLFVKVRRYWWEFWRVRPQ